MEEMRWPAWICPTHQEPLIVEEQTLKCPSGDSFPIKNGIPRFVPQSSYTDAFGAQWKRYRLTQLDSHTGTTITRDRARRCIGERLWNDLSGKYVLECGCGAGRFTEVLLNQGACVTSMDLSNAVEANQENFPQNATHRIAQADILHLPFAPQQYDVVFCLGVIQHTPNPEQTIECLYNQVKPGGTLVIDHYTYMLSWFTKTAPLFRRVLRHLPPDKGIQATERITRLLFPLHRMVRRSRLAQMALSRLSPVSAYYQHYPQLSEKLQREWALLDTHDTLTAWYCYFRTEKQIKHQLEQLGLEEIWSNNVGSNIEFRGWRPTS